MSQDLVDQDESADEFSDMTPTYVEEQVTLGGKKSQVDMPDNKAVIASNQQSQEDQKRFQSVQQDEFKQEKVKLTAQEQIQEDLGACLAAIYEGETLEAYFEPMLRAQTWLSDLASQ